MFNKNNLTDLYLITQRTVFFLEFYFGFREVKNNSHLIHLYRFFILYIYIFNNESMT